MVDAHVVTHLRDGLVTGLDYGSNEKTAKYVHASKLVKFRAEASDRFSPAAGKVIRFRLVDDCWLQSGTVRFMALLVNKTGHELTPIAPPGSMFRSMRLFVGGQVCETIDETTVLMTLLDRFKGTNRKENDRMLAHGRSETSENGVGLANHKARNIMFELPLAS